jgi:hypothetical protein
VFESRAREARPVRAWKKENAREREGEGKKVAFRSRNWREKESQAQGIESKREDWVQA